MAFTLSNGKRTVFGDQVVWEGTVTPDTSYPTGGENFTTTDPFKGEFKQIDHVQISNSSGKNWVWKRGSAGAHTIEAFEPAGPYGRVTETIAIGDFTDNTDATGYVDLTATIPEESLVLGWTADVTTGFTGDTNATASVGIAGDLDRFSADTTKDWVTAGEYGALSLAADGGDGADAAVTVRVTLTGAADFGDIAAGSADITVFYVTGNSTAESVEAQSTADLSGESFDVIVYGK